MIRVRHAPAGHLSLWEARVARAQLSGIVIVTRFAAVAAHALIHSKSKLSLTKRHYIFLIASIVLSAGAAANRALWFHSAWAIARTMSSEPPYPRTPFKKFEYDRFGGILWPHASFLVRPDAAGSIQAMQTGLGKIQTGLGNNRQV
jgi:hypothetical protein